MRQERERRGQKESTIIQFNCLVCGSSSLVLCCILPKPKVDVMVQLLGILRLLVSL